ncbi:CSTLP2 [Symbiodinium natans]|nr:CSTLP2 [Symbiodinium natans]
MAKRAWLSWLSCLSWLVACKAQEIEGLCGGATGARSRSLAQLWVRGAASADFGPCGDSAGAALRTVTLLVHCRQTREICELRRPLILSYVPFFKEVRWLLSWPNSTEELRAKEHLCEKQGDPYLCVTKVAAVVEAVGGSSGILYMHFDAVLAPCSFARRFDPGKIGTFGSRAQLRWGTFASLDRCNAPNASHVGCAWQAWHLWDVNREPLAGALSEMRLELPLPAQLSQGCWLGYDDFFYLPRGAFRTYGALAEVFARHNIHHEIAGPTALAVTQNISGLEMQDFACKLGVLKPLPLEEVTAPDFACGHEVHYQETGMVEAVDALIKGSRSLSLLQGLRATEDGGGEGKGGMAGMRVSGLDWGIFGELPALCAFLLAGVGFVYLRPDVTSDHNRTLFSYFVCTLYVLISVVIDLSMAVQSTHAPPNENYSFEPMCAVLLTELLKLVISTCLILHDRARRGTPVAHLPSAGDVAWLALPALIFTLNNILVWWAIGNNDISTFGVFRDSMILWTAFLWRITFGLPLGNVRLLAILVMVLGLALNQVENLLRSRLSWPLVLVLLMTACNAFGSVLNEFALKRKVGMDINIQNAVLYAATVLFTGAMIMISGRGAQLNQSGFFHGFTRHTMFTVTMQALAGLTVSRILKYSDAVQKNIAACLRGPILVVVSPAFVQSSANGLTLVSAAIVATGCGIYLNQGPLTPISTKAGSNNVSG